MMIITTSRGWIFKFSYIKINDNLPPNTCLPLPPTAQVGKIPPERWVWGARCLPLPPTAQGGSTPYMGWAHLHGGQSPFSLEYQTQTCPHPIWCSSNWNGLHWLQLYNIPLARYSEKHSCHHYHWLQYSQVLQWSHLVKSFFRSSSSHNSVTTGGAKGSQPLTGYI